MSYWLKQLSGPSQTFGTLGIARAIFLWKRYFKDQPRNLSLLYSKGIQQEGWFPAVGHGQFNENELSLEEELFQLQIDDGSI
jgi:hypothetical protein